MTVESRRADTSSPSSTGGRQLDARRVHATRRRFLTGAMAAAIAGPGALASMTRTAQAGVAREDGDDPADEGPLGVADGQVAPNQYAYSLAAGTSGPLGEGVTRKQV
jgi:hypothetical protein